MRFRYAYREGNGTRREAEITAESRDEAFAALRGQGIRPIKVVALDGSKENGDVRPARIRPLPLGIALVAMAAVAFFSSRHWTGGDEGGGAGRDESKPLDIGSPTETPRLSSVVPLERQMIPGDRKRVENAVQTAFSVSVERILAQFAEPGRPFSLEGLDGEGDGATTSADVASALAMPVKAAEYEFSESIDLKRIVEGMRRELKGYIAAGGTFDEYLAELVKRQRTEIALRGNAEAKIDSALKDGTAELDKTYELWIKANAQLQSMGIYPIPLPDALRDYQSSFEFDE